MKVKLLIHARLFVTPWIVACTKLLRPWDFQAKSTGVGCRFLLQGIFPTQGSNPGLSHCRQTLYHPSHHSNSKISRSPEKKELLEEAHLPGPALAKVFLLLPTAPAPSSRWLGVIEFSSCSQQEFLLLFPPGTSRDSDAGGSVGFL